MGFSQWFDIVIVLMIIGGGFSGFKKGFIVEVASVLALVAGFYAGFRFSEQASVWLASMMEIPGKWVHLAGFGLVFLAVIILVHLLAKILEKAVNVIAMKPFNKVGGLFFGVIKSLVIISVLFSWLTAFESVAAFLPENLPDNSVLYPYMKMIGEILLPIITDTIAKVNLPV